MTAPKIETQLGAQAQPKPKPVVTVEVVPVPYQRLSVSFPRPRSIPKATPWSASTSTVMGHRGKPPRSAAGCPASAARSPGRDRMSSPYVLVRWFSNVRCVMNSACAICLFVFPSAASARSGARWG